MKNNIEPKAMAKRFGLLAVSLGGLFIATSALGVPLSNQTFHGGNNLLGEGAGLLENYISETPGTYVAINKSVNPAGGSMPGMTESFRVDLSGRSGSFEDGIQGINLSSPGLVPSSDARSAIGNPSLVSTNTTLPSDGITHPSNDSGPLKDSPFWRARLGSMIRWITNSADPGPGGPLALLPFGSTTTQVYNMTPRLILPVSSTTVDDGLAPGSLSGDGIPDFLPFVLDYAGRRVASLDIVFFDEEDGPALFGGVTPTALIPRLDVVEDDGVGTLVEPHSSPLLETNFDFNDGNIGDLTSGHIDGHVDGTLALTGRILNAIVNFTWVETKRHSGEFELDIELGGDVIYDGGLLFDDFGSTVGEFTLEWSDIDMMASVEGNLKAVGNGGVRQDGALVDVTDASPDAIDAGGEDFLRDLIVHAYSWDYDFEDKPSARQTFNIVSVDIIPEPLTSSTALLSLGWLGLRLTRRR